MAAEKKDNLTKLNYN